MTDNTSNMPPNQGNTYKSIASEYFKFGYEPIPVSANTKIPAVEKWQKIKIDEKQVEQWSANGYASCSVGIRCNSEIVAADFDITNIELLQEVRTFLPDDAIYRIGMNPKCLYPLLNDSEDPIIKKLYSRAYLDKDGKKQQIEILTSGQQFIASGIHPGTKEPYTWHGGTLVETMPAFLPQFSLSQAEDMIAQFEGICDAKVDNEGWKVITKKKKPSAPKETTGDSFLDEPRKPTIIELVAKLKQVDPVQFDHDQDGWFNIIMAIHWSTDGSDIGLKIAADWSKTSPMWKDGAPDLAYRWNSLSTQKEGNLITFATICEYADPLFSEPAGKTTAETTAETTAKTTAETTAKTTAETTAKTTAETTVENTVDTTALNTAKTTAETTAESSQDESAGVVAAMAVLKDYIAEHDGDFTFQQISGDLGVTATDKKKHLRTYLGRLEDYGMIARHPVNRSIYQVVNDSLDDIVPNKNLTEPLPLPLPLGFSSTIKVLPGTVILIAGETNAGKSSMAMQLVREWLPILTTVTTEKGGGPYNNKDSNTSFINGDEGVETTKNEKLKKIADVGITYLSSEMSGQELGVWLADFGTVDGIDIGELAQEKVRWKKMSLRQRQAVRPGGITIVDYLQVHKDFSEIAGEISNIADRAGDGITVICIQTKTGEKTGRGGDFSLERARIAFTLNKCGSNMFSCLVRKCKYPKVRSKNPEDKYQDYRFNPDNGHLEPVGKLEYLSDKQRAKKNQDYADNKKQSLFKDSFASDIVEKTNGE